MKVIEDNSNVFVDIEPSRKEALVTDKIIKQPVRVAGSVIAKFKTQFVDDNMPEILANAMARSLVQYEVDTKFSIDTKTVGTLCLKTSQSWQCR